MPTETTAERPLSHQLFADDLPVSALKEQVSLGVLKVIATTAGLDVGAWGTDYDGFDATVKSDHDFDPYSAGPKLDVQLKCTGQEGVLKEGHLAWSLDARTCRKLSSTNRGTMAVFCVVTVPPEPGHWLSWPEEGLLTHCKAYFLRGKDIPPIVGERQSQTLHLPYENLLTPASLQSLMEEAARWRW